MTRLLCCAVLLNLASTLVHGAAPVDPLPHGARLRIGTARFHHGGVIRALAFRRDGKALASASHDQTVSVWEVPGGRERFRLFGHGADVLCVSFSPDGKLLASGGADGTLRLWSLEGIRAGQEVHQSTLKADAIEAVAFAPDGKVLAAGGDDGTVSLFDVATRRPIRQMGQDRGVRSLAWSADGKHLAVSGGAKSAVNLYDPTQGKLVGSFGDEAVQCLAFAPTGTRLASWEVGGPLRLWDAATGKQLRQILPERVDVRGPDAVIYQIAFAPDGRTLFVGNVAGTVDVYEAATLVRTRQWSGHRGRVTALAVSPTGLLASGGADSTVRLWNTDKGIPQTTAVDPPAPVVALSSAERGSHLALLLASGEVLLVDRRTGRPLPRQLTGPAQAASLSADGNHLAVVRAGALTVWDLRTGKTGRSEKRDPPFASLAYSANGKTLVTSLRDGTVTLRDADGIRRRDCQGKERDVTLVVAANGAFLAGVGRTATIPVWNGVTGKPVRSLPGHRGGTLAAAFTPDARLLLSGGRDRTLRLWNLETGLEQRTPAGHDSWVSAVACSPDGKLFASGTMRGAVHLWSARQGRWLRDLEGHRGPITALAFVDGGKALVSASRDASVILWETAKIDEIRLAPIPLTVEQRTRLWLDLRDGDSAVAALAIQKLARDPDGVMPLLRDAVKPVDGKALARWLEELDDKEFKVRDAAFRSLARLGRFAEGSLRKALEAKPSLEKHRRIEELLDQLAGEAPTAEHRRALRVVEILSMIDTPAARRILESLAGGAPEAELTRRARAAQGQKE